MASFSARFVRNIIPVSTSTGDLAISVINSSAPSQTLIVCNFGWALVASPGIEMKGEVGIVGAGAVAGPVPGAADDFLPQPLKASATASDPINCNPFIA